MVFWGILATIVSPQVSLPVRPGLARTSAALGFSSIALFSVFAGWPLARDGRRFVMVGSNPSDQAPRQIVVTLNWLDQLRRTSAR